MDEPNQEIYDQLVKALRQSRPTQHQPPEAWGQHARDVAAIARTLNLNSVAFISAVYRDDS